MSQLLPTVAEVKLDATSERQKQRDCEEHLSRILVLNSTVQPILLLIMNRPFIIIIIFNTVYLFLVNNRA
jgi:hypothetical protein